MKRLSLLFFLSFVCFIKAQNIRSYKFDIYDGDVKSTMRQFNQNYLSSYRILSRTIDSVSNNEILNSGIKYFAITFFGMPLTHEEGHRSVLTNKGIGSISQPFFNSKGAAYVKGVSDVTLKNLRDNDLPTYIHLHTAGLESDYALSNSIEKLLVFNDENFNNLKEEFLLRKISSIFYNITTFIPSLSPELQEEKNELDRDIVGHDIWGMIRHLHRPNDKFHRYTQFNDLTDNEQKYAKKLAWRSFTNLLSPVIYGKTNFKISNNFKGNFSLGHSLAPFGDYFDQNLYFILKDRYKVSSYIRENLNQNNVFMAGGISLNNYVVSSKINISSSIDLWNQPENSSFTSNSGTFGGSASLSVNYDLLKNKKYIIKNMGISSSVSYKTRGFLPEHPSLDKDLRIKMGFYFSY